MVSGYHGTVELFLATQIWHARGGNVPRTRTASPKRAEIGYGSASAGTAVLSPEVRRTPRTASARRQQPHQVPKVHEFHAPCVPARSERAESKKKRVVAHEIVPCTVQFRTRTVQFRTCTSTISYLHCT